MGRDCLLAQLVLVKHDSTAALGNYWEHRTAVLTVCPMMHVCAVGAAC